MGFVGRLEWVNSFSKKQCKTLFWRVKATVKKAVKNGCKQQVVFQYDPSSYALNFDDGCCQELKTRKNQDAYNTVWVYVVWVES